LSRRTCLCVYDYIDVIVDVLFLLFVVQFMEYPILFSITTHKREYLFITYVQTF